MLYRLLSCLIFEFFVKQLFHFVEVIGLCDFVQVLLQDLRIHQIVWYTCRMMSVPVKNCSLSSSGFNQIFVEDDSTDADADGKLADVRNDCFYLQASASFV